MILFLYVSLKQIEYIQISFFKIDFANIPETCEKMITEMMLSPI